MIKSGPLFSLLIASSFLLANSAVAQDSSEVFDLSQITCWDVMTLDDNDRMYALAILFGYVAGLNGKSQQSGDMIERALTQTGEVCGNNPDRGALSVMQDSIEN